MTLQLIDTHCHLYLPEFDDDLSSAIERAENEGVNKFYLPAIDSTVIDRLLETEKRYPGKCFAMMGLHPCSVKENYKEELKLVEGWLGRRIFSAVGEIGLDFYWDKTFTEQQYAAFQEQIDWALHFDIPVIIHSRNSIDECIHVVRENQRGKLKGIFHCFSGGLQQAKQIIDLGFYLGIGGVITFKNSGLDVVMNEIKLDKPASKMILGQFSEAIFILAIPFLFNRIGVKKMLLMGMVAWMLRYVAFAYGDTGANTWLLYAGIILHGVCYDFFFVTGYMYTEKKAGEKIKNAAQGLFTFATYGVGMFIGTWFSGYIVDIYKIGKDTHDWTKIWYVPAYIALGVLLYFILFFREKKQVKGIGPEYENFLK